MIGSLFLSVALTVSSLAMGALGHGYVTEVADPYMSPRPQRIIRDIPGNGPVENLSFIDVQCNGEGGSATKLSPVLAVIAAGSQMKLTWTPDWPDTQFLTNGALQGPVITYMARAPSDITKWNPGSSAVWFKVHEEGKDSTGKWGAWEKLFVQNKGVYTFTIPKNLRPGQYIIRHEIYLGVQIYPSCIQVEVTGSGNAFPTSFVSFPGAYTGSTPGMVYDIYSTSPSHPYPIPGPAVWAGGN
ncbi:glycoside hydrolase family 61 protein [Pterulicium gracile]|uniref:lytic cellulose monooxygenase (C4-dehydrogenating) n=1 Tax=Pterulicium gracile TaxID=1884261 RepID=A0A5C3Q9Z2_9AGAR|nr:glycoside hydrolase family 61 protein [Pterula gracilis]